MKKFIVPFLLFLSIGSVHAQFFFRAGGGYALPVATEARGENNIEIQDLNGGTISATSERVKASYGAGINVNLAAGYMFSKHIGAELNFSYLLGKEYEFTTVQREQGGPDEIQLTSTSKSNAVYITPSMIISTGEGTKVPYGKFGVVLGIPNVEQDLNIAITNTDGTTDATAHYKYQKGMSLGFMGALGMNWAISNNVDIVTEVSFISMAYYPKEFVLESLVANGERQDLSDIDEYDKKTVYKKKINVEENPDPGKPREAIQESLPFSSVSLQVSVVYFLGRKIE